jgi:two-component system, OmpR family, sensor histidine kinase BaeS
MAEVSGRRAGLGVRLGAAFVATALAGVVLALALALLASSFAIDRLVVEQRARTADDVGIAVAAAYEAADGWDGADLLPAHALAAAAGAVLTVTTDVGTEVPPPPTADALQRRLHRDGPSHEGDHRPDGSPREHAPDRSTPRSGPDGATRHHGSLGWPRPTAAVAVGAPALAQPVEFEDERTIPVVVDGREVGTATLRFAASELDPIAALRTAVRRNLLLAGGIAAMIGVVVAAWVSPQLTRPVRRLTAVVRRIADGDRGARARLPDAVGELGELARSVDRMAADLEREDRLRRALVADVAHEVRTPLTVLLGEVEALQDGVVPPDPERLASLHEEVLRLAALVEDLDAIAAAEAAGRSLDRVPVDLAEVAAAALRGLEEQVAAAGIELETRLAPATVLGDRRRLEQVVRNLLTNAVKFSPPGGRVTVRVAASDDEVVLAVSDDGPGIPEEELPHVFERFWRGRHAAGTGGSGVGLAVVTELAAAHGGAASADNVPGGGARLTVRLPRADLAVSRPAGHVT